MSISGLRKVIKENELYNNFIFPFGNSIIFTNKQILVRDDPNLIEYFGNFLLSKLIKDGSACNLGVEGSKIKFLGEKQPPDRESVKSYLEADITNIILLDPTKKLRVQKGEIETYELPKDGVVTSVVNRLYFDYLTSVGYDQVGVTSVEKYHPIYCIQKDIIRSVCMSIGP